MCGTNEPLGISRYIDATVKGSFDAEDFDGNGVIDVNELTGLNLEGRDVLGCVSQPPVTCGVSGFSYSPGGTLHIQANHVNYWDDNGGTDWSWNEIALDTAGGYYAMITRAQQWYEERDWMFTPETKFSISPVPEAQTYLMMLAGIFLLGAIRLVPAR
jgi:hypothetical protein